MHELVHVGEGVWLAQPQLGWIRAGPVRGRRRWREVGWPGWLGGGAMGDWLMGHHPKWVGEADWGSVAGGRAMRG